MPAASPAPPVRLVYILAASHSGSTLLALLLGSHPEICTIGEMKQTALGDLDRYRCSCGAPILTCDFWTAIVRAIRARGIALSLGRGETDFGQHAPPLARRLLRPLHRGRGLEMLRDLALWCVPGWRRHLTDVQARNAALAAAACEQTGKPVIVDSSKIGVRLKFLLRNPAFDVKVLRLVRDGRAVALTYMDPAQYADASDPALRGGGDGSSRDRERLPLERAAREWRRSNEEADALLATLPSRQWLRVRYEDLCSHPAGTMRRLFEFVGVDPNARSTDFRGSQHVIGNGMRLDRTTEIRLDARWRLALEGSDLRRFEAVAGELNRRLGYEQVTA